MVTPTVLASAKAKFAVLTTAAVLAASVFAPSASALSLNTSHDCDNNAVLNCGAEDTTILATKYDQSASAQAIYSYFGISSADVHALGTTAVAGRVTKTGDVYAGDTLVAKNALTVGRLNMNGSTKVTSGGYTFYTRTPSVSFVSASIPAYVVVNSNKQFVFAIIASCGNAVKATNVIPTPTPVPTPTPAAPTTTTTPTPPAPVVTQAAAPQQLVNTGPGQTIAAFFAVTIAAALGHAIYRRRKLA